MPTYEWVFFLAREFTPLKVNEPLVFLNYA